jgi:nucleotidyltransferase/DNA polymerase involved in DNA repair
MAPPPALGQPYLDAAAAALELVRRPEVERSWAAPSALAQMSVGALAAHLTSQVMSTDATLDHGVGPDEPVPVHDHYTRVAWRGAALDQETNRSIRSSSERQASAGRDGLLDQAEETLKKLAARLRASHGDTVVYPPWTTWSLRLDDFLLTRLVELSVHSDDLAVSVGVPTPELPEAVRAPVRHLLIDLAAQRHGDTVVLRALSRSERAPESIAAF